MNVFVRMLREVYGIESGIIEAPPRISLRMFGGPLISKLFETKKCLLHRSSTICILLYVD